MGEKAEEKKEEKRCVCERRWDTYASRVQQVSPSTSPPGALSVLTDSFSLAGMLTERQRWAAAEKGKKLTDVERNRKRDELTRRRNGSDIIIMQRKTL